MQRRRAQGLTFVPQLHLHLQRLKIVRDVSLNFTTHSFTSPLLEAVKLLVDIHDAGCSDGKGSRLVWLAVACLSKGRTWPCGASMESSNKSNLAGKHGLLEVELFVWCSADGNWNDRRRNG
jgi:hypothetical protein